MISEGDNDNTDLFADVSVSSAILIVAVFLPGIIVLNNL